jgi:hypothetical protein
MFLAPFLLLATLLLLTEPRCYGIPAEACVPAVTRFLAVAAMPVVARACYIAGVPSDVAEPAVVGVYITLF